MLDINANDTEYTISVEVPGIKQEDIKLEINNNILTIRGEKLLHDGTFVRFFSKNSVPA